VTDWKNTTLDRERDFNAMDGGEPGIPDTAGVETRIVDENDPEVDALVVEIASTRSEMAGTVDELADRLAPSAVADRAGEAVREATIGKIETKVNDMTTAASDLAASASETAQEAGSGLVETIRRNPIPAAMTAVGLGLLWMNRSQGRTYSRWTEAKRLRSGLESGGRYETGWNGYETDSGYESDSIGDKAQDAAAKIGDTAGQARRAAADKVDELGWRAERAANTVGSSAGDAIADAQRAIESNPLAFGAIAVAVGAAVGLALPATEAEKRALAEPSSRLIDQVENAVSEPLDDIARSRA